MSELKNCPFCGELPEIDTAGTCIEFSCCVSMSIQKCDNLTLEERETWDDDLLEYSKDAEEKALCVIFDDWNTRTNEPRWVSVDDELPTIPEKKHAVQIDCVTDDGSMSFGLEHLTWDGKKFIEVLGDKWVDAFNIVVFWQYQREVPKFDGVQRYETKPCNG